jgi:hypothetical protein
MQTFLLRLSPYERKAAGTPTQLLLLTKAERKPEPVADIHEQRSED